MITEPPALSPGPTAGLDPPVATAVRRPGWRFVWSHPAHALALGFGSGLAPIAPGTVGTLWAWATFGLLQPFLTDGGWALFLGAGAGVGGWACTVTARRLGIADPSAVVWDEILAFWLILWLVTPASLGAQFAAFLLFRAFDAVKPGPVAWADALFKAQRGAPIGWRQGFGILFDDGVAALCTLLVIAGWRLL